MITNDELRAWANHIGVPAPEQIKPLATELLASRASETGVSEESAAHYLEAHGQNCLTAMQVAMEHAEVGGPDIDDRSYWQHEIAALEAALALSPAAPTEGVVEPDGPFNIAAGEASVQQYREWLRQQNEVPLSPAAQGKAEPVAWRYRYELDGGRGWQDWIASDIDPQDWNWAPAWVNMESQPLYTHPSPPSISAGRDEGLEAAAKICDAEAAQRDANMRAADNGDTQWGADTKTAALAQGHKGVTAHNLAAAIRSLKRGAVT